jgi:amidase
MGQVEAHADCQSGIDATIECLERIGFQITEDAPPAFSANAVNWTDLSRARALHGFRDLETLAGRAIERDEVEPFVWDLARPDDDVPDAAEFLADAERRRAWAGRALSWWDSNDLLLLPTVCEPPVTLESRASETLAQTHLTEMRQMAFTGPFNETGQPSISLPLYWTDEGVPVGIQLVADLGRDDLLLAVAARLELMMPWSRRQPTAVENIAGYDGPPASAVGLNKDLSAVRRIP